MSDIVERLLKEADDWWHQDRKPATILREAAEEIGRLRKRLAAANDPTTNSKSTDWSEGSAMP